MTISADNPGAHEYGWNDLINDPAAYEQFYTAYYIKFFNYGKKFTPVSTIIEDAIQDVFMDLWSNRHKLAKVAAVKSYFFATFRYILLRKIREEKKSDQAGAIEEEPGFSIDQIIIHRELSEEMQFRLSKALVALTNRQREAIFLRFYQGLSYEEVAEVLQITVKATYKIMGRSLAVLKEQMMISIASLLMLLQHAKEI